MKPICDYQSANPQTPMNTNETTRAAFSVPSILSVIAAIVSFKMGVFFGLFLAAVAIVLGILGLLLSLSPKTRGGFFSILGVLGGAAGIIAAVIKAILWIANGG